MKAIMIAMVLVILFVAGLIKGVDTVSKAQCNNYGKFTEQEVMWISGWPNICYVSTENGWRDREEIRQSFDN